MNQSGILHQRAERERRARKEAETLLEQKSRELFLANRELTRSQETLEQRVAERTVELARANDRLQAADRAKSEFLANLSHEIRTPLNSILGFTELLRRDVGSELEKLSYVDTINSCGRHLSALIDDILDFSKIEAGHMEFERVRFSPHQIIREVLSMLRVPAQQKDLTLECEWRSGIPETISSDPGRVRQLLMNLVGNAIKFTEQGGVTLVASIDPDSPEPRFQIEVRDTGVGIPADQIERIFSPFKQADNSVTRRFGGTGLGLTISRYITRSLGGDITVESEVGRGTIFRVTLATGPLDHVRILDLPPTEALLSGYFKSQKVTAAVPARVLLVEDGQSNRELIRLVLEEAGAEVACAGNGQQALDAVNQSQFDLILMDMQMPVMDGYTATRRLRQSGLSAIPIIALTAHATPGDKTKCLAAGCSGYLSKPINIDELLQTVVKNTTSATRECECTGKSIIETGNECIASEALSPIRSTLPTDRPQLQRIVEKFVAKLSVNLGAMQAALEASDLDEVAELAHWLKGAGGTIGFDCFSKPASRVERLAKERRRESLRAEIDELVSLADRIAVAT